MTYHFLKIAPEWFHLIIHEEKTFEIRKNDRGFKTWDQLVLMEYEDGQYTGRYTIVQVKFIVPHEMFPEGIKEGYCVLDVFKNTHGLAMKRIMKEAAREQGIDPDLLEVQL